jgi:hypothetical protein
MDQSAESDASASVSGSIGTSTGAAHVELSGIVGVDMSAEGHLTANKDGLDAGCSYHDAAYAEATVTAGVGEAGVGIDGSATTYVRSGTEVDAHVVAGTGGVDVGAEASIGTAVGVDAEVSGNARYVGGDVGAGVSVGEHFEAGGSAHATCEHGVVSVGVAGDVAAVVGLDVDVGVSVDTRQIAKDGAVAVHAVEGAIPVATHAVETAVPVAASTTKSITSTISNGARSATNAVKKAFKKIRL